MRYSVSILGKGGRDRMVVGFTTTCAISGYPHRSCEVEPRSWQGVLDTTLCDKVCQWFAAGRWFSPGNQVSTTNKTDHHNITEILLKVALNTITLNLSYISNLPCYWNNNVFLSHNTRMYNNHTSFHDFIIIPEALKSLYHSPGNKKKQLVLCKNYVLQW
jgi:hypothetical protein